MSLILPGIEHVVVLMMENRSFDNVLGGLYPAKTRDGTFYGLTGEESNPDPSSNNETVTVWQGPPDGTTRVMPFPDPGEHFSDIHQQLFGSSESTEPTMQGFVANYLQQHPSPDGRLPVGRDVMHYYAPGPDGSIPITSALAQAYAVSDMWFASGPVQTLANRNFVHCASPGIHQENGVNRAVIDNNDILIRHPWIFGAVDAPSVYQLLDEAASTAQWPWPSRTPWKVYYHDFPLTSIVKYVRDNRGPLLGGRLTGFGHFVHDVANDLPTYSFVEPRYTNYFGGPANSNHPGNSTLFGASNPINVHDGEILLRDVYSALYHAPNDLFARTLLVVIYDEHGGLHDHMPPPPAVSPFPEGSVTGFDYSRYGVRVPAIFINPFIQPETIHRPPQDGPPFDHTSIISTLREQFGLGGPLTRRDAGAPTLANLIDPDQPRNPFSLQTFPLLSHSAHPHIPAQSPAHVPEPGSLAAVIKQALENPHNQ